MGEGSQGRLPREGVPRLSYKGQIGDSVRTTMDKGRGMSKNNWSAGYVLGIRGDVRTKDTKGPIEELWEMSSENQGSQVVGGPNTFIGLGLCELHKREALKSFTQGSDESSKNNLKNEFGGMGGIEGENWYKTCQSVIKILWLRDHKN